MFQIDDKFLESLGLGALPADDKEKMKAHIYETLEMRVGMTLASNMSEAQLDEFEGLMNNNDEEGALRWLETNFPNYRQVVADELEKLKQEISASAADILAATNSQSAPDAQ
jgi:predicted RNA-binding Zn ribbon-like protein